MPLLACSPHYWLSGSSLVSLGAKQSKQRLSVDLPIATGRLARKMPTRDGFSSSREAATGLETRELAVIVGLDLRV